jgi:hypothetical protein
MACEPDPVKMTDVLIAAATAVAAAATFLGPIVALWLQRKLDEEREQHRRRVGLYRQLMMERATNSPAFVQALNAIPLEFNSTDGEVGQVRDAWKIFLAHTGKQQDAAWGSERIRLLTDLLLAMGKFLKYRIDRVEVENGIYFPKGHGQALDDQEIIRQGLVKILKGDASLPLDVKNMPADPEMVKLWRNALIAIAEWPNRRAPAAE